MRSGSETALTILIHPSQLVHLYDAYVILCLLFGAWKQLETQLEFDFELNFWSVACILVADCGRVLSVFFSLFELDLVEQRKTWMRSRDRGPPGGK